MKLFATVGQQSRKITLAINNKQLDNMVWDRINEGMATVCPGRHPTETS